ncbi:MAG: biotin--[acetyl-CoA-carboxylase] ligase [Chitinophagales bacterium]
MPDPTMDKQAGTTFDNQLIELDSVDSTNNYAMGQVHAGLASGGQVYFAHQQWAGKGQRGKTWVSERGQNISMSLVLDSRALPLSGQFLLSAAVSLGCLKTAQQYETEGWKVKWPNDLYWRDRKAAGILIENIIKGKEWSFAVIGVGMNLNQDSFPAELSRAVSLKQITCRTFDPLMLAAELTIAVAMQIEILKKGPETILTAFNQSLYKRGEKVTLKLGNHQFETRIGRVNAEGLLEIEDGRRFRVGEVEFVDGG